MSKSAEAIRITIAGREIRIPKPDSVVIENKCPYCGKVFDTDDLRAVYCKPSHGDMYNRKMKRG